MISKRTSHKLIDVIDLIGGGTPKTIVPEYWGGDIPWLSVKDFNNDNRYVYTTEKSITKMGLDSSSTNMLSRDDIIISARGTVGELAMIPFPIAFNQSCYGIRGKKDVIIQSYLYYLLKDSISLLKSQTHGSVFDTITRDTFASIDVSLPSLEEQQIIADTLIVLDDKIAMNRAINHNLAQITQTIFKMWFIDFEFPNQEGKPYKTAGGKMIYNDEVETEIPEGWKVTTLEKVAEFTRGFSYNGKEKNVVNGDLVFMTLNSIYEGGGFKREFCYLTSKRLKDRHLLREGDIIIANTEQTKRGTLLGFPALVEFPNGYSKKVGCFSHHITKVTPAYEELKYYIYCYLLYNQADAVKYHTGSVIWSLDISGFIKNEKIVLPAKSVVSQFYDVIDAIFQKKLLNNKQVTKLSALRDNLLPMLMSGKIRLPH